MTLNMIHPDPDAPHQHYPQLGSSIKAAETRHLLPCVYQIATEWNDRSEEAEVRILMLRSLCRFYDLIEKCPTVPSRDEGLAIKESLTDFLNYYQWMADWAASNLHMLYGLTQKFHNVFHLAEQAQFLNPRNFWVYSQEDFIGRISVLAHSCTPGTSSSKVSTDVAEKLVVAMHFEYTRRLGE